MVDDPNKSIRERREDLSRRTPLDDTIHLRYLQSKDKQVDELETAFPTEVPTSWSPSTLSHSRTFRPSETATPIVELTEDYDALYSPISTTIPKGLTTISPSASPILSPPPSTKPPSLRPTTQLPSQLPSEIPSQLPSQLPKTLAPTNLPLLTPTPATKPPSQAPTPIKQYLFLHVFDIRMQFEALDDIALLTVWSERIRTATEAFLLDRLPYGTLESVQLYAIEKRRNLTQQPQHSFRYGGVALFRGYTPKQSELQLQQRLVIGETLDLQEWFRQRYSIFDAWVLFADFASDGSKHNTTDQTEEEKRNRLINEDISYLIIAGASGAAIVALLLLLCVLCRLCRSRPDGTIDTVQKFHPNARTFSEDDDEKLSPQRAKSCMMQIVDVDRHSNQRPLVLPSKLLCALPNVEDESSSCVSGYSLGSHLQPPPSPQPKTRRYLPTTQLTRDQEDKVLTGPTQAKKVPTVADLRDKTRMPSWVTGENATSSIHANESDSSASQSSTSDKFEDTNDKQHESSVVLGPPATVTANNDNEYDDELVHSLQGRNFDSQALLDEARMPPRQKQQERNTWQEDKDVETRPFDESSNREGDVRSTDGDNFDSVASKLEEDIARLKHEIDGRRKSDPNDDANVSQRFDHRVAEFGSVRVHR